MHLVVQSAHTLDELQNWVVEIFSQVPNRGLAAPAGEPNYEGGSAFSGQNISKIIRYLPIKDRNSVDFCWSLPPQQHNYKIKPLHYLGTVKISIRFFEQNIVQGMSFRIKGVQSFTVNFREK